MGIYIKGMDISEIEELVLTKNVQLIFRWTSDMKITAKTRAESDSGIVSYSKEFEIVEVPEPHGRLIDADELVEKAYDEEETDGVTFGIDSAEELEILFDDDAPTVIEAEGDDYDYERASDMRDYCEMYEPTYNTEDGSM